MPEPAAIRPGPSGVTLGSRDSSGRAVAKGDRNVTFAYRSAMMLNGTTAKRLAQGAQLARVFK
jgi:hypothetical protein